MPFLSAGYNQGHGRRRATNRPSAPKSVAGSMENSRRASSRADPLRPVRRAISMALPLRLAIEAVGWHSRGRLLPCDLSRTKAPGARCIFGVVEACAAQQNITKPVPRDKFGPLPARKAQMESPEQNGFS